MDNGGGVVYVVILGGVSYLSGEALLLAISAAALGAVVGVVLLVGGLLSGLAFMWNNPLRSAKAWCLFVVAASTAVSVPFLVMYTTVLNGRTELNSAELGLAENLLTFACGAALLASPFVVVSTYKHCQRLKPRT